MSADQKPRMSGNVLVVDNPWRSLRKFTTARIGLGRAGISQPTQPHLDFQLAHARARDAVHSALDIDSMQRALGTLDHETILLHSAAPDRMTYLQRPDLGRKLDAHSIQQLAARRNNHTSFDVVFVVADGLSATAIHNHAVPFLEIMIPQCREARWRLAPLVLLEQGRVAASDEIGSRIGAGIAVILIGERPGLSSPDSMGIYLTHDPRPGRTDAERNCISNVREAGLSYEVAAHKLFFLINESLRRKISGVNLKEEARIGEQITAAAGDNVGNFLVKAG